MIILPFIPILALIVQTSLTLQEILEYRSDVADIETQVSKQQRSRERERERALSSAVLTLRNYNLWLKFNHTPSTGDPLERRSMLT